MTIAPVRRNESLTLARNGFAWRVSGTVTRVPWGRAVGHVVTVAEVDGAPTVALIATRGAKVTEDRNLALEPRDTLTFQGAPVVAAKPVPGVRPDAIRLHGAMARAAQMAGALDSILEQGVRYATERKQFGRPIANFQAIQHNLAIVAGHVAASGIAAELAFRAADRADRSKDDGYDPGFEAAVAKIRVGEAAGVCAGLVHQVHGAIGFTYEHSLHFATRRLWSWRAEFGSENGWAIELGRRVAARGPDNLWADLTER
jgi:acyl-CoA dehydrogenase